MLPASEDRERLKNRGSPGDSIPLREVLTKKVPRWRKGSKDSSAVIRSAPGELFPEAPSSQNFIEASP